VKCSKIVVSKIVAQLIKTYCVYVPHVNRTVRENMDGQFRKQFVVAVVSLAVGAAVAGVLSNSKSRGKLIEGSKKLVGNFHKSQ
jgi:hypothetical protein